MNILICPDSFKHSLTAYEVAQNIARGIKEILSEAETTLLPLADGGEGTVRTLVDATGGRLVQTQVHDPLMREITAPFGILGDGETAVIEMASASGIELLKPEERNPLKTTTYGTGELIKAALDHHCSRIILGVGGSATIDGGAGSLAALGAKFLDASNEELLPAGGNLHQIKHISTGTLGRRLPNLRIQIGTDVNNPLTGKNGAAAVYGPQKGASPADVERLDTNLNTYANLLEQMTGKNYLSMPGAGAAGGLAITLMAFTHASLENGFNLVARETGLEKYIQHANLIITGEGKIDFQTRYGKTAYGVAQLAKKHNKPLIAVAGTVEKGIEDLYNDGFDLILPITEGPMKLENALKDAPRLLKNSGMRIGRIMKLTKIF